jgi:hypothetical protein
MLPPDLFHHGDAILDGAGHAVPPRLVGIADLLDGDDALHG